MCGSTVIRNILFQWNCDIKQQANIITNALISAKFTSLKKETHLKCVSILCYGWDSPVHNRSSDLTEKQFWLNLQTKHAFCSHQKHMGHSMPNHPKSEKFPGWPSQILMKIGSNAHLRIWWPHAKKFCHLAISFIFIVTYIQGGSFLFLTHDVEFEWLPVLKWW